MNQKIFRKTKSQNKKIVKKNILGTKIFRKNGRESANQTKPRQRKEFKKKKNKEKFKQHI